MVWAPPAAICGVVVNVFNVNIAVHVLSASIVTTPSEQSASPLQPVNTESAAGDAVKVRTVPRVNSTYPPIQSVPQIIPKGEIVTVPLPVPVLVSPNVYVLRSNMAVHVLSASIVTTPSEQSASPPQPANVEFASGAAISVTDVPELYNSVQSAPQSMPEGELVICPLPAPDLFAVRVYDDI